MRKQTRKWAVPSSMGPSQDEQKAFDFFWQHLRLNPGYLRAYADLMKKWPRITELETIRRQRRPTPVEKFERLGFEVGSEDENNLAKLAHLPGVLLNPDITNSNEALLLVLNEEPAYFRSPEWQMARWNGSQPLVAPNLFGIWGNKTGTNSAGTVADLVEDYKVGLKMIDCLLDEEEGAIIAMSPEESLKFEQEQVERPQQLKKEADLLKRIIAENPVIDFAIDTSLPIGTIAALLKEQLTGIKNLRKALGLPKDIKPGGLREWKAHLVIWNKIRKYTPSGQPKFTTKLLKKLYPTNMNKFGEDFGMNRITPVEYKRKVDALRSQVSEGFKNAKRRIEATFPEPYPPVSR